MKRGVHVHQGSPPSPTIACRTHAVLLSTSEVARSLCTAGYHLEFAAQGGFRVELFDLRECQPLSRVH